MFVPLCLPDDLPTSISKILRQLFTILNPVVEPTVRIRPSGITPALKHKKSASIHLVVVHSDHVLCVPTAEHFADATNGYFHDA